MALVFLATTGAGYVGSVRGSKTTQGTDPRLAQLQLGWETYRIWCSACHAYSGEGLTAAWRSTWAPDDQNCWQSKCHSLNHPDDGFLLPHSVPAIIGPGILDHFQDGATLFRYVSTWMPYQEPGVLSGEQYYAVLAHVLNANGIDYGAGTLGPDNIGGVLLQAVSGAAPIPVDAETGPAPVMPPPAEAADPSGSPNAGLLTGGILGSLALAAVAAMAAAQEQSEA
jgi:hypothetical protein